MIEEPAPVRYPLIADVQAATVAYFGLKQLDMVSRRRGYHVSKPRQVAMYLSREMTPKSLPTIGRYFGGRDHTTVIYAVRAVQKRMDEDPLTKRAIRLIRARINRKMRKAVA